MGESPYLDKPNGFAMNFLGAAPRFCNAVTKKLGTLLYFCWYIFITRPLRCLATGWLREIGLTSIQMHCVYIYISMYIYTHILIHMNFRCFMMPLILLCMFCISRFATHSIPMLFFGSPLISIVYRGVAAEVMRFLTTPASHKIQRKQFDEDISLHLGFADKMVWTCFMK